MTDAPQKLHHGFMDVFIAGDTNNKRRAWTKEPQHLLNVGGWWFNVFYHKFSGSISEFLPTILHNGSTVCLARHQLHPNSVVHEDSRSKWPPATSLVDFVSTQALPLGPERNLRDRTMAGSNVFGTNVCQQTRNQTSTKKHYVNQRTALKSLKTQQLQSSQQKSPKWNKQDNS